MVTKTALLNALANKKLNTSKGSIKYYTIGALRILIQKDAITVAEVEAEFPELATV